MSPFRRSQDGKAPSGPAPQGAQARRARGDHGGRAGGSPAGLGGRQPSGQQRHGQDRHHPFDDLPDNQPHVGCSFQVDAEGSQGADVKHKVFWVTGGGVQAFTGGGLTLPMLLAAVALLGLGAASLLTGSRRRRRAKASM